MQQLAGMQEDLHMSDVEWSAGISLFYVGYIISQVEYLPPPICFLLTHLASGPSKRRHR